MIKSCLMEAINNRHDISFVEGYDIMITFNGKCFDIPIISRWFNGPRPARENNLN